jgi:serine/threonine-protein kinase
VWTSEPDDATAPSALHLRRLDSGETTLIPGAEKASQPFFSPDGRWIDFVSYEGSGEHRLRKLAPRTHRLRKVPAEGGPPRGITTVDRTREADHQLPSPLPGGQAILMTAMVHAYGAKARIEVVSLASGEGKVVAEDGADARYLPTGHLVFVRRGVLMAAPFDLRRLELTAPPVPVVERVCQAMNSGNSDANSGAAQFAVSESGLLVYARGGHLPL